MVSRLRSLLLSLAAVTLSAPACGQPASPPRQDQPQAARPATRAALAANVRVFDAPAGSRPQDVAPAPDGRVR